MKRSGLVALLVIIELFGSTLSAQRRGGGGNFRSSAQTNVNHNTNVNRTSTMSTMVGATTTTAAVTIRSLLPRP
jgi:hypothetical protein